VANGYLTVVVDHTTRAGWSGRPLVVYRKTVERFLDELGEERCKQIKLVSCDMGSWIAGPVADRPGYNLTDRQAAKLSSIQKTNARLYRAYLLKEQLRQIYRLPVKEAIGLLDEWVAWARRCRLPSFVKLVRTITAQRAGIVAAIEHGLSNARVEAINTQIRMITAAPSASTARTH